MSSAKIVFAVLLSVSAVAMASPSASSMDTQIRQASVAISKLAEQGLHDQYVAASSQDTQMNVAKAAIAKLAEEGLRAQEMAAASQDTQINVVKAGIARLVE
jgi:hypothetical protein